MLTFLSQGERMTAAVVAPGVPRRNTQDFSRFGWRVGEFYQYLRFADSNAANQSVPRAGASRSTQESNPTSPTAGCAPTALSGRVGALTRSAYSGIREVGIDEPLIFAHR